MVPVPYYTVVTCVDYGNVVCTAVIPTYHLEDAELLPMFQMPHYICGVCDIHYQVTTANVSTGSVYHSGIHNASYTCCLLRHTLSEIYGAGRHVGTSNHGTQ
jgi:hypothetical protein